MEDVEQNNKAGNIRENFAIIISIIAVIIALFQNFYTSKQIDEMQKEQRPWLKVNVALRGPLQSVPFENKRDVFIVVKVNVKNVGKSPAFNIRFREVGFVQFPSNNLENALNEFCSDGSHSLALSQPLTTTIFPDDEINIAAEQEGSIAAQFKSNEIENAKRLNGGLPFADMHIFGCVDYSSTDLTVEHHTWFSYALQHAPGADGIVRSGVRTDGPTLLEDLAIYPDLTAFHVN